MLDIVRILAFFVSGFILYLSITILHIGATFVIREALLYFCGFDLYEWLKSWIPKPGKKKKKIKTTELTESDAEWLKNRGRY